MRIFKSHPLLNLGNSYVIDSPQPSNISFLWNFGSLLGFCLMIQIITGVTLAMHYNPSVIDAFNSVEHIMRDVNNGWLIRYLHSNTASAFFFIVYLHIGRGLYYGSYKAPRTLVWTIGTVIFILMMATAFLGYVLPYGQMSLWGATVITNLMSAIPWVGQDIVEFIWGGFSVNNATLNRFFALHFVLPFVLAALALMHLIALHDSAGSGNPLGTSANPDRLPFAPYFIFKDLITIFLFIVVLSMYVFFMPNVLGDSENYVVANPMQTPPAIVPEWYLLPFYAILRSIPNKLLGVIAMFAAILALLTLPFTDLSKSRGLQFRPLSKIAFYVFIANFLVLMELGAKHVESPYIELGQFSTILYFAHFLIIMPFISFVENTLIDVSSEGKSGGVSTFKELIYKTGIINVYLFIVLALKVLVNYLETIKKRSAIVVSYFKLVLHDFMFRIKLYELIVSFCIICVIALIYIILVSDVSYAIDREPGHRHVYDMLQARRALNTEFANGNIYKANHNGTLEFQSAQDIINYLNHHPHMFPRLQEEAYTSRESVNVLHAVCYKYDVVLRSPQEYDIHFTSLRPGSFGRRITFNPNTLWDYQFHLSSYRNGSSEFERWEKGVRTVLANCTTEDRDALVSAKQELGRTYESLIAVQAQAENKFRSIVWNEEIHSRLRPDTQPIPSSSSRT